MNTTRFAHHRLDAFHVALEALVAGDAIVVGGCGGNPTTLASGQQNLGALITSAATDKVFWTAGSAIVFATK